jgi:light-regulated signal transduction histidine kinase (bacteriophytochrome)
MLGVIQRNANKMNTLIDDLLEFSRMGRKEVGRMDVDMREVVDTVIQESQSTANRVKFQIGNLPHAMVDRSLITQVWTNLISNGVKYSGKHDTPVVEIGSFNKDNQIVFFVKDNGAGFEMQYADKLFGVFQRLHKTEDFEGTGIGLAIVHRVVTRHGGRVWAEGKPGDGATFYFSLPNTPVTSI